MKEKVILLTSDQFGNGEALLGSSLLETFMVLIKQEANKPAAVFCLNKGVTLLTEKSLISVHLKELADQGVPVLACKTCLDYYGVGHVLTVGQVSSMKEFVELARNHEVITIG